MDNEPSGRSILRKMLQEISKKTEVVGESASVEEAAQQITRLQPDVVFLDIELPGQNGFELFDYFPFPSFSVIFATAESHYAAQAFRLAAVDYLLKPFKLDSLRDALRRAWKQKQVQLDQEKLKKLQENFQNKPHRLSLPIEKGLTIIEVDSILRCEASRNHTNFFLTNGEKLLVFEPLRRVEELLKDFNFFRVNRSNLINLKFIKRYEKSRQGLVTLTNEDIVVLSKNQRLAFLDRIQDL